MLSEKPNILVVDDIKENLLAMSVLLEDFGVNIITALSGNEALKKVLKHDLALVIMDVQMPMMDGFEAATIMRKHVNAPIIFVTATSVENKYVFKGYDAGAVDYMLKPIEPEILKNKVRVFLNLYEQKRELIKTNKLLEEQYIKLQYSEEKFKTLVQTIPDIIYQIDLKGRFVFLNDAIKSLGYDPDKLIGEHFSKIILPSELIRISRSEVLKEYSGKATSVEEPPKLFDERRTGERITKTLEIQILKKTSKKEEPVSMEIISNDLMLAEISSSGMYKKNSKSREVILMGSVGVMRDMTERKKMEERLAKHSAELLEANKGLKKLDHLKSMFIASMSHELRTPLNSIIGFTGIILQGIVGDLNTKQKDHLSRANRSAKHLLELINDVIDISKIEAGKSEIFVEEFTLGEFINEAVDSVQPHAKEKGLALEVSIPPGVLLNTDKKRVRQCILNYLSNAIKFTEAGAISVTAREIEGKVEIMVSDTGIGISEQDQEKLFESFVRLDSHLRTKTLGTGLGLYLTRKLATEMLGGTVAVKSHLGQGSTFTLRLPKELKQG